MKESERLERTLRTTMRGAIRALLALRTDVYRHLAVTIEALFDAHDTQVRLENAEKESRQ